MYCLALVLFIIALGANAILLGEHLLVVDELSERGLAEVRGLRRLAELFE